MEIYKKLNPELKKKVGYCVLKNYKKELHNDIRNYYETRETFFGEYLQIYIYDEIKVEKFILLDILNYVKDKNENYDSNFSKNILARNKLHNSWEIFEKMSDIRKINFLWGLFNEIERSECVISCLTNLFI